MTSLANHSSYALSEQNLKTQLSAGSPDRGGYGGSAAAGVEAATAAEMAAAMAALGSSHAAGERK